MLIDTKRLSLIPLTLDQLKMCIEHREAVERELGLNETNKCLSDVMKRIYNIKTEIISKNPGNLLFCTYWQIVLKEKKIIIGEIGFKGAPNSKGEIEVGYGIDEEFQGSGYMTEALKRLLCWAFTEGSICTVNAATEKGNTASQRVLQKSGFNNYKQDGDLYWWRITKEMED